MMTDTKKHILTSYDDMMESYQTTIVETKTGKTFEIQSVSPGDFMLLLGSPLIRQLTMDAVDLDSPGAIREAIDNLPPEKQIELVSDPSFIDMMKEMVCRAVVSINLVDKLPSECDPENKEVPIELLAMEDIMNLYTATMTISVGDAERKDFYSFRETLEDETGEVGISANSHDS